MVAGNIKKMIPKQTFTSGLIKYPRLASTIWFVFMAHIYILTEIYKLQKHWPNLRPLHRLWASLNKIQIFFWIEFLMEVKKGWFLGL